MDKFKRQKGEKLKPIYGYEELYLISSLGRVLSFPKVQNGYKKIEKKIRVDNRGYYRVCFGKGGVKETKKVHRLVAEAFIPNPLKYKEVNHLDCNKLNNCVENLEWCDRSQNITHAMKNGLIHIHRGESKVNSVLTNEMVIEIYTSNLTAKQLSDKFSIKKCNVYDVRNQRSWNHITKYLTKVI